MSRFDATRWNRILIWTGAALTWGTAMIATWLEPARGVEADGPEPVAGETAVTSQQPIMPSPTARGLVILRFTPVDAPQPEVRTVVVNRSSGGASSAAPASAQAAPQPASSGS
jgi:hypothetical protein